MQGVKIILPKLFIEPLAHRSIGERNAICALLILKSIDKCGNHLMIQSRKRGYRSSKQFLNLEQKIALSALMHCTQKTIDNHVSAWIELKLAKINGCMLVVESYDGIAQYLGLRHAGLSRYVIVPTFRKLGHIVEKLAIEKEQTRRKEAFKFYTKETPFLKEELGRIVGDGESFRTEALWHKQLSELKNGVQGINAEDEYVLFAYRADFNPNYKFLGSMFGYNSKGGVAAMKRRLYRQGLISYRKRSIDLNGAFYTTRKSREKSTASRFGRVFYSAMDRKVSLYLCDEIACLNHNFEPKKEALRTLEELINA